MITLNETPANQQKLAQLQTTLGRMMREVLQRGFHGSAEVELVIHDGTIQTIRRRVEQLQH
jgi:hypothetical protein